MKKALIVIVILLMTFGIARRFFNYQYKVVRQTSAPTLTTSHSMSPSGSPINRPSPTAEHTDTPAPTATSQTSNGIKYSVPLEQIIDGGAGKDGIPSLDNPKFVDNAQASRFVSNTDRGLGLCVGTVCRFYPFKILLWHEIVNDWLDDTPVAVTYAPLSGSAIVYDRTVSNKTIAFGTSGKLWRDTLVMYGREDDRGARESFWSQLLGEAIVGPDTGTHLTLLPSSVVAYGDWLELHPSSQVLSQGTGFVRPYGYNPYADYNQSQSLYFGVYNFDQRLSAKEPIIGLTIGTVYKAYALKSIPIGETADKIGTTKIRIQRNRAGEIRILNQANSQTMSYVTSFWFAWRAIHPSTLLFQ